MANTQRLPALVLNEADRSVLTHPARSRTAKHTRAWRAQMLLAYAEGGPGISRPKRGRGLLAGPAKTHRGRLGSSRVAVQSCWRARSANMRRRLVIPGPAPSNKARFRRSSPRMTSTPIG
ncbi:MAG: hypothetical protein C7B45_00890 [Sulfobacillus acidophilus]|uniref:Uncharacterized protein n=1 Tax=Sulfobacillus acidophilus TaxID=53633 RepID=A0A2T2WNP6_9FIRM|nr:MAG: hypothetical protein C7B45_00890 [Sulfobacillus acidophilus]